MKVHHPPVLRRWKPTPWWWRVLRSTTGKGRLVCPAWCSWSTPGLCSGGIKAGQVMHTEGQQQHTAAT